MNIFIIFMIFIMGTFFGSFFTLAVYRIPLKKDITHEHSFCPTCNHRLGVLDLIPVLSYVFLRGKCRYCGEKVRIRYLILEVLSGIVFVISYLSLNIQNIFIDVDKLVSFISFVFMYITLVIIAGIDKEYIKINKSVLLFGVICQTVYMLYLYMIENASIYRYIIYLIIFVLYYIIDLFIENKKENYLLQIILLLTYIVFAVGICAIIPILLLSIIILMVLYSLGRKKYNSISKIPFGFIICFSTVVYKIVENFIIFYCI